MRSAHYILIAQGIYTILTSLWPIIHIKSFLFITGPKTDVWLVKLVSLLLLCMGISFLMEVSQKHLSVTIKQLALNSAVVLFVVDLYYSYYNIIPEVYVIDGFIQLLFICLWMFRALAKNRF
jgi:hypothetical protein